MKFFKHMRCSLALLVLALLALYPSSAFAWGEDDFPKEWSDAREELEKDSCTIYAFSPKYKWILYFNKRKNLGMYNLSNKFKRIFKGENDKMLPKYLFGEPYGNYPTYLNADSLPNALELNWNDGYTNCNPVVNISPDGKIALKTDLSKLYFKINATSLVRYKRPWTLVEHEAPYIYEAATMPVFDTDSTFSYWAPVVCDRDGKIVSDDDESIMLPGYKWSFAYQLDLLEYLWDEVDAAYKYADSLLQNNIYHYMCRKVVYNTDGQLISLGKELKSPSEVQNDTIRYGEVYSFLRNGAVSSLFTLDGISEAKLNSFKSAARKLVKDNAELLAGCPKEGWLLYRKKEGVMDKELCYGRFHPQCQVGLYDAVSGNSEVLADSLLDCCLHIEKERTALFSFSFGYEYEGEWFWGYTFLRDGKMMETSEDGEGFQTSPILHPLGSSRADSLTLEYPLSPDDELIGEDTENEKNRLKSEEWNELGGVLSEMWMETDSTFSHYEKIGEKVQVVTYNTDGEVVKRGKPKTAKQLLKEYNRFLKKLEKGKVSEKNYIYKSQSFFTNQV